MDEEIIIKDKNEKYVINPSTIRLILKSICLMIEEITDSKYKNQQKRKLEKTMKALIKQEEEISNYLNPLERGNEI